MTGVGCVHQHRLDLPLGQAVVQGRSRCRGSVMTPVSAAAAAVSGEHSHTESSLVPERPGKLRGKVRSEFAPAPGLANLTAMDRHVIANMGAELHAHFGLSAIEPHRFEFLHDERAGGVLRQRLIDADADRGTRSHLATDEVLRDQLLSY